MRTLLEEKQRYRQNSFDHLERLRSEVDGWRDEFYTREYWQNLSFLVYDYINRIFIKGSSLSVDFLKMYDYSLAYCMKKLSNISEILLECEGLLQQTKIHSTNIDFTKLVFDKKEELLETFDRIRLDDRPLYNIRPIDE